MIITRGSVVLIDLNPTVGHERGYRRPCIVVSSQAIVSEQRCPMMAVIPLTKAFVSGPLYPRLQSTRMNGLSVPSSALTDHVRSIDPRRVERWMGVLAPADLAAIDAGLRHWLDLP